MSFDMDFDDRLNKIFIEKIEDEEEYDAGFVSELEPEEPDEKIEPSIYDDDGDDTRDWTNIPTAKAGKELKDLKNVKKPLENGWTVDELMSALKPNIIYVANKYHNPNFSKDDAVMAGMEAVMDALRTDKGIAPFTSHVFPYMKSKVKRAAAGTREFPTSNVSGIKPNEGGTTDFLKGSKATTSADAPVGGEGEEKGTFSSRISGDASSGGREEKDQMNRVALLHTLFNSEEVGLTDTENLLMHAMLGISRDGSGYSKGGEKKMTEIADALNVSKARASQIRGSALRKIQSYMQEKGHTSPEDAMASFGIGESKLIAAASIVVESMKDILALEIELLQEHQEIPIDIKFNDVVRHAVAKVNTDTLSVDDVVAEGGESILGKTPREYLSEARRMASAKLSKKYFSETVAAIVQMHSVPILGVIGVDTDENENDEVEELSDNT